MSFPPLNRGRSRGASPRARNATLQLPRPTASRDHAQAHRKTRKATPPSPLGSASRGVAGLRRERTPGAFSGLTYAVARASPPKGYISQWAHRYVTFRRVCRLAWLCSKRKRPGKHVLGNETRHGRPTPALVSCDMRACVHDADACAARA